MVAVVFAFDGRNPEAQEMARLHGAEMVTRVSQETRQAIRLVIQRSISEGITPRDAAKLIRDLVGLTSVQSASVMNYRATLVKQGVLNPSQVSREVARYAAKRLADRAEGIARTEVMGALNRGRLLGWTQAVVKGFLSASAWKQWVATPDEDTCPICNKLHGTAAPLQGVFLGGFSMPPAHPRCRCTARVLPDGPPKSR